MDMDDATLSTGSGRGFVGDLKMQCLQGDGAFEVDY